MAISASSGSEAMKDLNTTPLIDVMLVLLVMFIITIPVATHSTDIDLPTDCRTAECPLPPLDPVKNTLVLRANNALEWNGTPVTRGQLAALLAAGVASPTEPQLRFEPEASASYDASLRTLDLIRTSGVTNFGFVNNHRYARFDAGT